MYRSAVPTVVVLYNTLADYQRLYFLRRVVNDSYVIVLEICDATTPVIRHHMLVYLYRPQFRPNFNILSWTVFALVVMLTVCRLQVPRRCSVTVNLFLISRDTGDCD